jgi:hypothetical protein
MKVLMGEIEANSQSILATTCTVVIHKIEMHINAGRYLFARLDYHKKNTPTEQKFSSGVHRPETISLPIKCEGVLEMPEHIEHQVWEKCKIFHSQVIFDPHRTSIPILLSSKAQKGSLQLFPSNIRTSLPIDSSIWIFR